ncbi:MAG: SPOR domain-containing protein [Rickettsiales bacterium]|jgi:cell division septation protein DedD|nr:SPOR domain-containing protein [Rickettsiales bacterium]
MADQGVSNDILDFDDETLPELPDDNPFGGQPGKSKRWLLVGLGVVAVTLMVVVVLKLTVGGRVEDPGLMELPIEQLPVIDSGKPEKPADDFDIEGRPVGMPERVVEPRKEVVFDPDKPVVSRPKPRPVRQAPKPAKESKPAKPVAPKSGTWSVQVGSYPSRAAAERGQRQLKSAHKSLFSGKDFAILSAVLPNGSTTYRLRVVNFKTDAEAKSFQKTAKSNGVDGYVAR